MTDPPAHLFHGLALLCSHPALGLVTVLRCSDQRPLFVLPGLLPDLADKGASLNYQKLQIEFKLQISRPFCKLPFSPAAMPPLPLAAAVEAGLRTTHAHTAS